MKASLSQLYVYGQEKNVGRDARQAEDDVEMLLKETTASLLNSSKVELKAGQSLAGMADQLPSLAGNGWQVLSVSVLNSGLL
jgi:hypothetical protein